MNHLSLFSGIGGFDLAAQWMGWNNIAHCEINPFCRQILSYYWPEAASHSDIKTTDFSIYNGAVDIVSGGFPCQPYSTAGLRKGKEDDRHLWPEMLRAIREISPRWVVGENVRGLTNWNGGVVFDEVQADLEAEGYEVLPFLLPACAVNAPHRRDRIWFIAYSSNHGSHGSEVRQGRDPGVDSGQTRQIYAEQSSGCGCEATGKITSDTPSKRCGEEGTNISRSEKWDSGTSGEWLASGTYEVGLQRGGETRRWRDGFENDGSEQINPDTQVEGLEGRTGVQNPHPRRSTILCQKGDWRNFPTFSPICSRNDGFPGKLAYRSLSGWRNEAIKSLGNAIVPQIAYQIFKSIQEYERNHNK